MCRSWGRQDQRYPTLACPTQGRFLRLAPWHSKHLWHFQTGTAIYSAPTTYMLDGRQWLLVPSGTTLYAFAPAEPGGACTGTTDATALTESHDTAQRISHTCVMRCASQWHHC